MRAHHGRYGNPDSSSGGADDRNGNRPGKERWGNSNRQVGSTDRDSDRNSARSDARQLSHTQAVTSPRLAETHRILEEIYGESLRVARRMAEVAIYHENTTKTALILAKDLASQAVEVANIRRKT